MSSLRAREEANRVVDGEVATQDRTRLRRAAAAIVLAVAFLMLAGFGVWRLLSAAAVWQLDEARQHLQASLVDRPEMRLSHARQAEETLNRMTVSPATSSPRNLLTAAALSVQQQALGTDHPETMSQRIEELCLSVQPRLCSDQDVYLAAQIFASTERPTQAGWLTKNLLSRKLSVEERTKILILAANVHYELGDEVAAIENAREFIKLRPDDPSGWRVIAAVHEDTGVPEPLVEAYGKLLTLAPEDEATLRRKLAERQVELGQVDAARQHLEWLQAHAPDELKDHPILIAETKLLSGETDEALRIAESIIAQDPAHEKATLLKAKVLLARSKPADATRLLRDYLRRDPFSSQSHYLLGQALAREGETEQAQRHLDTHRRLLDAGVRLHRLQRQLGRDPDNATLQREIARLARELGLD